ncbi:FAD-binding protein [Arthrobacter alpinus]|nr:FAD-binding protein [Arthrobacter alpinus]
MGHFPQSHQEATLGGYVATRSSGQSSTGYGRSDQMVKSAHLETPQGPFTAGSPRPARLQGRSCSTSSSAAKALWASSRVQR